MKRILTALALLCLAASPAAAQQKPLAPDPVVEFSEEDAAMNGAIEEARRTYPQFLADFAAAPAHQTQNYMVKVGLPADGGGQEHIWVDNLRRENGRLVGALANEPVYLPGMHLGSRVEIDDTLVSDWAIITAQGMYGSYTTRVMLPFIDPNEAAQLRAILTESPVPEAWSS
jgi:uncharacterized protein YegJ (DUF2314 family)